MVTMYMMMVHSLSLLSLTTGLEQSVCVWQHSFSHINDDVTPLVVKSNLANSDEHKYNEGCHYIYPMTLRGYEESLIKSSILQLIRPPLWSCCYNINSGCGSGGRAGPQSIGRSRY